MSKQISIGFVLLLLAILIAILSGCVSTQQHRMLTIQVQAASNINPNQNNQASPVVIMVYQLKDNSTFKAANFFGLYLSPQQTLESTYVDSNQYIFLPGEKRQISIPLGEETSYVGVVAAYRNINNAQWIVSSPVSLKKNKQQFLLNLYQKQLVLSKGE